MFYLNHDNTSTMYWSRQLDATRPFLQHRVLYTQHRSRITTHRTDVNIW